MSVYAQAQVDVGGTTYTLLDLAKQELCLFDQSADDELTLKLQIAGEAAEAYTGNKLCLQAATELFPAQRSPIVLQYYPIVSLTTVLVGDDDMTIDYAIFKANGSTYLQNDRNKVEHPSEFKQITVTYQCGYDPMPLDLAHIIVKSATNAYQNLGGPVKRETVVGVGSVEYLTAEETYGNFPASALGVLDKYKRIYV